jgi:hypothetical protein
VDDGQELTYCPVCLEDRLSSEMVDADIVQEAGMDAYFSTGICCHCFSTAQDEKTICPGCGGEDVPQLAMVDGWTVAEYGLSECFPYGCCLACLEMELEQRERGWKDE